MTNTLKKAAFEKQELIDKLSAKKRCLIEKRLFNLLPFLTH